MTKHLSISFLCTMVEKLNSKAAKCIESGKFPEAIDCLTQAFQIYQEEGDRMHQENVPCKCRTCTLQGCLQFSQESCIEKSIEETDEEGYIFRHPIRTTPHSTRHLTGTLLPTVISFNLGLSYQLYAMRQDDDILFRRNLEKSLKYYGLAYNFASNLESSSLNFNIILANNIGMIHYAIGTKEKYERCLQFVLATLMYARSS